MIDPVIDAKTDRLRPGIKATLPAVVAVAVVMTALAACAPKWHRERADKTAADVIENAQEQAVGRTEPFTVETPADTLRRRLLERQGLPTSGPVSFGTDRLEPVEHWPEKDQPVRAPRPGDPTADWPVDQDVRLALLDALQVAARNSREYQSAKEDVFRSALALDLERDAFNSTYAGIIRNLLSTDHAGGDTVTGVESTFEQGVTRRFQSGAELTGMLAVDLVRLLSGDRESTFGIMADATMTIPLMRGAGRHIAAEPLTQAQRNVIYAIWSFERFKRTFAVDIASEYLSILRQLDQVKNAANNYRRLIHASRRAQRLNEADRLERIQLDQAVQDELRARNNWISAQRRYEAALDRYKVTLGLPTDALIELDPAELTRLADRARSVLDRLGMSSSSGQADGQHGQVQSTELRPPSQQFTGPYEMDETEAIHLALDHRLDLRVEQWRVEDAQRRVVVAADALRAGLALTGTAAAGERRGVDSADLADARLRPEHGRYTAGLVLDLPWERTAEGDAYRLSFMDLERQARSVQALEDQVKLDVRDRLGELLEARESYAIQAQSVELAEQRVASTKLFLEAGEAQIRDVLDAEEDLLEAQDAVTSAVVDYRVSELRMQRDTGLLQVDEKGLWREHDVNRTP
ncbi:MAG: transporter [Phycisphaeraceae bacterium]|nr:transporter [Phycisphaeraceae bacterium]